MSGRMAAEEESRKGPPRWDGGESAWPEWSFEFMQWSRRHDDTLPQLLREAAHSPQLPSMSDLSQTHQVLAGKVMTDLAVKTSGAAKRILMNLAEDDNGFAAWHLLSRRCEVSTGMRATSLLTAILKFDFSGRDFRDRLVVWEGLVRQYERQQPTGEQTLATHIKIAVVAGGATGDLKKQLLARTMSFTTYEELRRYIDEYFDARRVFVGPLTRDHDPMDVDYVGQTGKGSKGKKGKGKDRGREGKGRGDQHHSNKGHHKGDHRKGQDKGSTSTSSSSPSSTFAGYCGVCGRWGHKARECFHNPNSGKSGKPQGEKKPEQVSAIEAEAEHWILAISPYSPDLAPVRGCDVLIDSGASISVVPWEFGKTFELERCKVGELKNACGEQIRQYGKRCIPVTIHPLGHESRRVIMEAVVADVSRPILSVSRLESHGFKTIFAAEGERTIILDGGREVHVWGSGLVKDGQVFPILPVGGVHVMRVTLLERHGQDSYSEHSDGDLDVLPIHGDWAPQRPGEWVPLGDDEGTNVFIPDDQGDPPVPGDAVVQAPAVLRSQQERVRQLPLPNVPEQAAKDFHISTGHANYQPWCESCVAGRGREDKHQRVTPDARTIPHVFMDYGYLTLGGGDRSLPRGSEEGGACFVVATDASTGAQTATIVSKKGNEQFVTSKLALWLERLGHAKVILVSDGEHSLRDLARSMAEKVKKNARLDVSIRSVPRGSSASNGPAEQAVQSVAGGVRTLLHSLRIGDIVGPKSPVVAWLVSYVAWSHMMFTREGRGQTPYYRLNGQEYGGSVVPFGSWVMLKKEQVSHHRSKLRSEWIKGVWVGKSEVSDAHIVCTREGAVLGRTIERLGSGVASPEVSCRSTWLAMEA